MNIKELFQEAQRAETPTQAIGIYEKIIQQDPQNSEAYNNIGELYGNMGQPERALPYFVKATELNPMNGVYYSNLALVLHCQGHVEEAISNYSKSIALQPSWSAYNNRATLYNYRKEYDNAIADCTTIHRQHAGGEGEFVVVRGFQHALALLDGDLGNVADGKGEIDIGSYSRTTRATSRTRATLPVAGSENMIWLAISSSLFS